MATINCSFKYGNIKTLKMLQYYVKCVYEHRCRWCILYFQLYLWNVRCSFWMHCTLCRHGTVRWSRVREIQQRIRAWRCLYVLRFCEFNVLTVIIFPEHIEFVFILGECKRPNHSDLHFGGNLFMFYSTYWRRIYNKVLFKYFIVSKGKLLWFICFVSNPSYDA